MKTYTLFRREIKNDNTTEYGFGEFPRVTFVPVLTIESESVRSAQAKFRKTFGSHIKFAGQFAQYQVSEK